MLLLVQSITQLLQLLPHTVCKLCALPKGDLWQKGPTATQQQQSLITTGITCKRTTAECENGFRERKTKRQLFLQLHLSSYLKSPRSPILSAYLSCRYHGRCGAAGSWWCDRFFSQSCPTWWEPSQTPAPAWTAPRHWSRPSARWPRHSCAHSPLRMATRDCRGLHSDGMIIQRREEERDETGQRQTKRWLEVNTVVILPSGSRRTAQDLVSTQSNRC